MTSVDEIDRDREAQASTVESARVEKSVGSVEGTRTEARDEVAHKRERGKPFDSDRAREAARLSAERRRARQAGDDTSDEAIEQALRRKAARGDVAAARELRERARVKLDVATETTPRVVLEDMSNEELERLRERLLRMAVRMNERAARAQARAEGRHPLSVGVQALMSARPQQLDPSKQLLTHERCPDRSAGSCRVAGDAASLGRGRTAAFTSSEFGAIRLRSERAGATVQWTMQGRRAGRLLRRRLPERPRRQRQQVPAMLRHRRRRGRRFRRLPEWLRLLARSAVLRLRRRRRETAARVGTSNPVRACRGG